MSYALAFVGAMMLMSPLAVVGFGMMTLAVAMHGVGVAGRGAGELGEMVLFYGAIVGICCLALPG